MLLNMQIELRVLEYLSEVYLQQSDVYGNVYTFTGSLALPQNDE